MDDRHMLAGLNESAREKNTHTQIVKPKRKKFIGSNRRYIDAVINKLSVCLTYYTPVAARTSGNKSKTGHQ